MTHFIDRTRDRALHPETIIDTNTGDWAARAYSILAILGTVLDENPNVDDSVIESLIITLSKAPTEVVAAGTLHTLLSRMDSELPDFDS